MCGHRRPLKNVNDEASKSRTNYSEWACEVTPFQHASVEKTTFLWEIIDMWLGVCEPCPALWMSIGSGGGVASTFPTKGWAMVTGNCWEYGGGSGHRASLSMPCYMAFYRKEGKRTLAFHTPVFRDRETDACPQCQGLARSHSLTASPTVSSYITPSPFPSPLPAFIGLFLSFSTLALHLADHCFSFLRNHPTLTLTM